jgi:poly(A) polymerase
MTDQLNEPWMSVPATAAVVAALEAAGGPGVARFVGGCVRDALLGRPVSDIDIATILTPDAVIAALEAAKLKAVPTGVEHGTVTAVSKGKPFEITTLRRDVETDGRRAVVAFTTDWAEDAARRDFRLNALYLEPDGTLHDPTGGGIDDARAGRIIFVGDAQTRIREDYLRVLRFFRFHAWFGKGAPDAVALAACRALAGGVAGLSGERVSKELLKLLVAPDPRPAVAQMEAAGVARVLLGVPLDLRRFEAMTAITPDPELRLAALLPSEPAVLAAIATRLRLSRTQAERLVATAGEGPDLGITEQAARRRLYAEGAARFRDLTALRWAEAPERTADARRLLAMADGWTRPVFPAGGADARACGVAPGPEMGRLLKGAEAWWIDQDFRPDREAVLARLAELARGGLAGS